MADIAMTSLREHSRDGVDHSAGEESSVPEAVVENLIAQGMAIPTVAAALFTAEYTAARAAALADGRGWQGNQLGD